MTIETKTHRHSTPPDKGIQNSFSRILIFCVLAYSLSWAYWIPFLALGTKGFGLFPGPYGFANGMFGPMLAALIMRVFISREGLAGSLGIKRPVKWYALAMAAPAVFAMVLVVIIAWSGLSRFTWPGPSPLIVAMPFLFLKALEELPLGIGEEYGWRGYLLPLLLPLGEVRATVLLGIIWGFWHLPMMVMGLNYPGADPFLSSIVFMVLVVLMSFPFTWLYRASRGSVLVVALFHITLDVFTDTLCSPGCLPDGDQILVGSAGLVSIGVILVIVVFRYGMAGMVSRAGAAER